MKIELEYMNFLCLAFKKHNVLCIYVHAHGGQRTTFGGDPLVPAMYLSGLELTN